MASSPDDLMRIVDAAVAESVRRAGPWIACRPGCTACCVGAFAITELDAERLRAGLERLAAEDPARAVRVGERARASVLRLSADFPGNPVSGTLGESDDDRARFDSFADDEPCPALDPGSGLCDLYDARPVVCRLFGAPLRMGEDAFGVCELCFEGASEEEIAACAVATESDPPGDHRRTLVAWALA